MPGETHVVHARDFLLGRVVGKPRLLSAIGRLRAQSANRLYPVINHSIILLIVFVNYGIDRSGFHTA